MNQSHHQSPHIKYTFNHKSDSSNSIDNISFFYQICIFPDPSTNKFHMRKFIVNGDNNFLQVKNFRLSKKQYKKFFSLNKPHEYKCFSVFSLDHVNFPSLSDILLSKSNILSTDYNYSGFAPF